MEWAGELEKRCSHRAGSGMPALRVQMCRQHICAVRMAIVLMHTLCAESYTERENIHSLAHPISSRQSISHRPLRGWFYTLGDTGESKKDIGS